MKFVVIILISLLIVSCSKQSKHEVMRKFTYQPIKYTQLNSEFVLGADLPKEILEYCTGNNEKIDERLTCSLALDDTTKFEVWATKNIVTNIIFELHVKDGNFINAVDELLKELGLSLTDVGFDSSMGVGINLLGEELSISMEKVGPCSLDELFACYRAVNVGNYSNCPADHELRCGENSPEYVKISARLSGHGENRYIQFSNFTATSSTPATFGLVKLGQEIGLSNKLKMKC